MLAGANPSGVFTVSLNAAAPSLSQPSTSSIQTFPSAGAIILPQPVQQVSHGALPQLVSGGQIVNLTPVRAADHSINNTTPTNKNHSCSFCQKSFSSRYNVTRHEKICKLNTAIATPQNVSIPSGNNKQFICISCQKMFQSQESLNRHQKKCKASNSVSSYKPVVNVSNVSWSSRKVHLCKFCGKEFSTKWNVIRHERLFHDPNDPVIVPQSVANGMPTSVTVVSAPGKPERYCRFCGNYFSSKYNAIRHEKICTRVQDGTSNDSKLVEQNQHQQQQQPQTIQLQQPPPQQQQSTLPKPLQITSITGGSQTILIPEQAQQVQQQAQQQTTQQEQQRIQQQIVQQQQINQQVQQQTANIQANQPQQQQILPQQTMLLIEQPTTPFHVCKFCNKQLATRCDPGSHNLLSNMQTVATITGQPMQIGSSGTQLAGIMTPVNVMASLPQVTLVQPQFSTLQGQQLIQQQQPQIQQEKDRLQAQQPDQQTNQQNEQVPQQQITLQHIRLPQQQQIQTPVQHNGPTVERPHACKYCDKHFASKWYLDQHEKIHTGEADMCKECGKYFVTRWHLDKHMRVHMSAEPSAKKSKKDTVASTAAQVLSTNTVLTGHVTASSIDFPEVIIGPGQTTSPANSAVSRAQTFTVSSRDLQHFLPSVDPITSQAASNASSSTQDASGHPEEHTTIDKSQIASTLSMSYT